MARKKWLLWAFILTIIAGTLGIWEWNKNECENDLSLGLTSIIPYPNPADTKEGLFQNHTLEDVELGGYGFSLPFECDLFTLTDHDFNRDGGISQSPFGPRNINKDNGCAENVLARYDYHQGFDITGIFSHNGTSYSPATYENVNASKPPLYSMCDGRVISIGPKIGQGNSITIKCDQQFNVPNENWGHINIKYNHLSTFDDNLEADYNAQPNNTRVQKGDRVGYIGKTDANTPHLHLSVQRARNVATNSNLENVHPYRVFDPEEIPHLISPLKNISITKKTINKEETIFRFEVLPHQLAIRQILISKNNGETGYYNIDFEEISLMENKECYDIYSNLEIYPYRFNGSSSAKDLHDEISSSLDERFPASNQNEIDMPIVSLRPVYIFDIKVNHETKKNCFDVMVIDVWGNRLGRRF